MREAVRGRVKREAAVQERQLQAGWKHPGEGAQIHK
jgi:hypothetical protein